MLDLIWNYCSLKFGKSPVYQNFLNFLKSTSLSIILSLAFHMVGQAQDKKEIDSLSTLLKEKLGIDRFEPLFNLSKNLMDVNNENALRYVDEAYELAEQNGDSLKIVMAGRLTSQIYRRLGRLSEAIVLLNEIKPIAKRNQFNDEYKSILNQFAIVYTFQANYDKALDYHFESLVLREKGGKLDEISMALNNIGFVYFKLRNYDNALKYYQKSLEAKRTVDDNHDLDRLLINIGLCYNQLEKFEEGRKYIIEGLTTCKNGCSDQIIEEGKFGIGVSYFQQQDYENAEKNFLESLSVAIKLNEPRWQAENLVYLAKINIDKKNFDRAKSNLVEAESKAKPAGYSQLLIDTYRQYSLLYNTIGDFEKASFYQQQYIQLKDSLIGEELVKNIAKVQTNYEERENIATIKSKQIIIDQQRDLNVAIAVISFLAGLLILVLQRGNRNIKRVNAKLSEAKEIIQQQNEALGNKNKELDIEVERKTEDLARANQSLQQVNAELDNFIYKTSHDIRGPLASLKGMCNVALLDVKDPLALSYLSKLDITAERLNSILTRLVIINQINNSKLSIEKIEFENIVNDVMLLEKKKGLPSDLSIIKSIGPNTQIHSDRELVRIVLENLIDNAIKFYNDSSRVDSFVNIIIILMDDGFVKVRIIDNGIGISESSPGKLFQMFSRASERSETGGIGLYITKIATEKLGGKVGLLTTPEGYTEFYAVFPTYP
ncbi:MAG: tetratricopeptide repeat-containing sensor histidine kinase [Chryseolinea sp.]